jgi:hypothetical protein
MFMSLKMKKISLVIVGLLMTLCACGPSIDQNTQKAAKNIGDQVRVDGFKRLAHIKDAKKQEVINYFSSIKDKVGSVQKDKQLHEIFIQSKRQRENYDSKTLELKFVIDYSEFYDLLLVDPTGFVFNSIRKESDFQRNVFTAELLGKEIQALSRNEITFVDYNNYRPSKESAAFFVVPITEKEIFEGWLIFQLPMNKINWILTDRKELGRTGEVYLVNQSMALMTESRFIKESSALNLRVETEAAKKALHSKNGEGIIEDYRGVRVFSSFEKFEQLGATWIIIAEIDEAEILTEAFLHSEADHLPTIATEAERLDQHAPPLTWQPSEGQVVDIGEFHRSAGSSDLLTYGVATCTAVGIQLPGRFAYLTHISPVDDIYSASAEKHQNLLAQLLARITYFELLPVEKKDVQFVLVAPHTVSLAGVVNTILSQGFDLQNIRICINRQARGANIFFKPFEQFHIDWYGSGSNMKQNAFTLPTLQDLYAQSIGYSKV